MSTPRAILFVDGENLTFRYQEGLSSGQTPHSDVQHETDCFVWHPGMTTWSNFDLVRVCYYTSVVGDDSKVTGLKRRMSTITYRCRPEINSELTGQVVPIVFKKSAKNQKTRNVDIQIVIDIMRFALSDAIDLVYLASGDGDYLPLVSEVMRHGKQVYVAAFSSGLNAELTHSVDEFFNLDGVFFVPQGTNAS